MGTNGQITDHEKEEEKMIIQEIYRVPTLWFKALSNMNRYEHNNNNGYFQQLTSQETKALKKSTED